LRPGDDGRLGLGPGDAGRLGLGPSDAGRLGLGPGDDGGLDLGALRRQLADAPDGARLRPLGLSRVVTGAGAVAGLADVAADLCPPGREVVVLAAATPISAGGRDLRAAVEEALAARFAVRWVSVGPGDGVVHADEPTLAAAAAATARAACVVTVGSGTITDIGKVTAGDGTPLVAVQTATSVNGYADPFSVLLHRGVKRTAASRWPDALVIDPEVLLDAPPDLNRAGAGDMMAMFTANADWYLASAVLGAAPPGQPGDPPFHPAVAGLVRARGPQLLALAAGLGPDADRGGSPRPGGATDADRGRAQHAGLGAGGAPDARPGGASGAGRGGAQAAARPDPGSLAELAGLLTLSGIAMGVAGSTAPASGMEHAVSHLLEMAATARGEPASFHGIQVGVASIVAARTWAHVLRRVADGGLDRPARLPDPDAIRDRITRAFAAVDPGGAMAEECFADYARKLRRLGSAAGPGGPLAALRASWAAHRDVLDGLLAEPAVITGALRAAGLPARFCDLPEPVGDEAARWAVASCPLQRQRFGVADLAMLLGVWEDADIEEVMDGVIS
jgi:glycerol-1-phosphate dehydrogenase [NAD(P)+]